MTKKKKRTNLTFHEIARFRSQLFDGMLRPYGLTMSQAWVLSHLVTQNGQTQKELASNMDVGTVTLGGLVDRLEARGLVERKADPKDRRANRVFATKDAIPIVRTLDGLVDELDEIAFKGLPDGVMDEMAAHLETIRDNLLAELEKNKTGK